MLVDNTSIAFFVRAGLYFMGEPVKVAVSHAIEEVIRNNIFRETLRK